jgi:CheY-like chemotaxis protein
MPDLATPISPPHASCVPSPQVHWTLPSGVSGEVSGGVSGALSGGLSGRAATLMLVEDSRHAAEAVRLLARRLGMRLRRADSLSLARQHLRVYRPDVALIDLGLPDGSGLELIAELALARPRLRRIVALSADPDAGPEARAAGACAFVAKPLRLPGDLAALLGPEAPVLPAAALPDRTAGRNAGADPLALRDDLMHARDVLARPGPGDVDYVVRFVQGVARCVGDPGLHAQARAARQSGDIAPLLAALSDRTARPQLL